jgi:CRP/FNR family transcriptional regulator
MTKVTTDEAALDRLPYLRVLPPDELRALASRCILRAIRAGEILFEEGQPVEGVFIILTGVVRVARQSPDGREQVLHIEGPGATLAEVPAFDGGGAVATAVAAEATSLLLVPRAALVDACRRHPDAALEATRVLAGRVRHFASLVHDLSLRGVTERVARLLMHQARRTGARTMVLPGTRDELAARLGTVREAVSRALSDLARDGLIAVDGRRVAVLDEARLAGRAGAG